MDGANPFIMRIFGRIGRGVVPRAILADCGGSGASMCDQLIEVGTLSSGRWLAELYLLGVPIDVDVNSLANFITLVFSGSRGRLDIPKFAPP